MTTNYQKLPFWPNFGSFVPTKKGKRIKSKFCMVKKLDNTKNFILPNFGVIRVIFVILLNKSAVFTFFGKNRYFFFLNSSLRRKKFFQNKIFCFYIILGYRLPIYSISETFHHKLTFKRHLRLRLGS